MSKKRKLYQTKNAMFYSEPTIVSRLIQLWDNHREKYSVSPKVIYVAEKDWDKYNEEIQLFYPLAAHLYNTTGYLKVKRNGIWFNSLLFRGISVIAILDKEK